jgi:glycosyltransferase involved in cell wall biosynthesis
MIFHFKPPTIAYNYNPWIEKALASVVAQSKYDAVHLNHADAGQYLRVVPRTRYAIDTHNLLFDFHAKAATHTESPKQKLLHRLMALQMAMYEQALFRRCDRIIVCSEAERDRLHPWGMGSKVKVIPNGVDRTYFRADDVDYFHNSPSLIFTGNMAYRPNRDAVWFFVREILPLVRRTCPELRLLIVGKEPGAELEGLPRKFPGVIVTGAVDDVRTYIRQARVFVAPLRLGSGTRLKLLEAFSMGIPAVATSLAAEGLECVDGQHILLADDPLTFARRICQLLSDRDLHDRLSRNSRRLAESTYDWRAIGKRLVETYAT